MPRTSGTGSSAMRMGPPRFPGDARDGTRARGGSLCLGRRGWRRSAWDAIMPAPRMGSARVARQRRRGMQRGTTLGVLILAAALAACNGFPDLVPVEVARTQPPEPLVEQTARVAAEPPAGLPVEITGVAGRDWMIAATEQR